ncbi:hypothetical protein [Halomonas sp. M4R1S46]|uniref:hypothetical protein n=1 Tax=Halomonas sp. M4R1S46 TaxID=2982692 RepID=UPI0021E3AC54|nr:hypothetical protein [Halomonas sp. M4R1S46]UYG06837.1 hypothetical protein OCT48_14570 [Halomonas sp. M4R1S46]
MPNTHTALRVAGAWLAIASFLLVAALIVHGPLAHDLSDQMKEIADGATTWSAIHWVSAASLSLFAVTGLIVLSSGSRLAASGWTMTAWAVLTVSALWTMTTAVAEATVVTNAAVSGTKEIFEAWWAFAEGKASGIAFLALSIVVISGNEAQSSERVVPAWSAWIAMISGVASFAGWALGRWFGVDFGNLLWVVSSVVMSMWTLWFGFALMRSRTDAQQDAPTDTPKPRG